MKKKIKIIGITILLISSIFILGIHILNKYKFYKLQSETQMVTYSGIIQSIENDIIVAESFDSTKFTFCKKGVSIQDCNGNEMSDYQLNVGDTIDVINKERKLKESAYYYIELLDDVKLIRVLDEL